MRRNLLTFFVVLLSPALFAADSVWQPEKTWVFAVGVLNFDTQGLATWPDEGRVDAVMIDAYKKRGVPADRIVFIKNKDATKARVVSAFKEFLAKTGPEDTLVFYYAGHGGRNASDPKRATWFVTYDTKAGLPVTEVFDLIEKNFKGTQVLLTADCCHSGALAVAAAQRDGRIGYGVLTSAFATSSSTGNWTFTQCLVDMLNGSALFDANNDGKITFAEAAKYCENEMAFCEGQLSCSAAKGRLSTGMTLAKVESEKPPRAGDYCEAMDAGKWWKVKILDSKDGKCFVTWPGWGKKYDRWVEEKSLRPYTPKTYDSGMECKVEWNGTEYDARILKNKLGLHLVHYEGYPDADDEWVALKRIQPKK